MLVAFGSTDYKATDYPPRRRRMFVGIDVGADRLHAAVIDEDARLVGGRLFVEDSEAVEWAASARAIAIDAPASLSTAPHLEDMELGRKFRTGRCAEVGLGRSHRIWVPWVTPTPEMVVQPWIQRGFNLFADFAEAGHTPIEVFPYAGYRVLAGTTKLPPKSKPVGLIARARLMEAAGVHSSILECLSHDSLDAVLAALVAKRFIEGTAVAATCGHDDSAIWLP